MGLAHLAAVTPSCRFIECQPAAVAESPLRRELVVDELEMVGGKLALPQKPGLGVEINPEAFNRFAEEASRCLDAHSKQGVSLRG
jgi:L-alanine-DL-glutamate epimerase-like enolase superfamily enzyme